MKRDQWEMDRDERDFNYMHALEERQWQRENDRYAKEDAQYQQQMDYQMKQDDQAQKNADRQFEYQMQMDQKSMDMQTAENEKQRKSDRINNIMNSMSKQSSFNPTDQMLGAGQSSAKNYDFGGGRKSFGEL